MWHPHRRGDLTPLFDDHIPCCEYSGNSRLHVRIHPDVSILQIKFSFKWPGIGALPDESRKFPSVSSSIPPLQVAVFLSSTRPLPSGKAATETSSVDTETLIFHLLWLCPAWRPQQCRSERLRQYAHGSRQARSDTATRRNRCCRHR